MDAFLGRSHDGLGIILKFVLEFAIEGLEKQLSV